MNGRVKAIMAREWEEARKNPMILLTAGILGIIFALLPALLILPLKVKLGPVAALPAKAMREALGQFLAFFFLLPVMIPSTIASYSIIGEKQNRSLESLLATPITTSELLLGKSLAFTVPSIIMTWVTYAVSVAAVYVIDGARFIGVIWQPGVIGALLLFAPMMVVLSMLLLILISARSSDPREAQQWAVLIVIPMMALGIGVGVGKIPLTIPMMALAAAGMAVISYVMLRIVTALFQREVILTRWK